jgi:hypothetical protein
MGTFSKVGRRLYYNGNPAYLAGIHAGTGGSSTTDFLNPPFDDDMLRLTKHRNNFFRHWLIPYWKYSPVHRIVQRDCAFNRENGKWNLLSYNVDYFRRLLQMIETAGQKGIVVQLVLFDRSGLDTSNPGEKNEFNEPIRRWDDSPWNANNNVHGVIVANPAPGLPEFYHYHNRLRQIQQAWIELVVDQTKSHWNVFYEMMNEPIGGSPEERVRWADWVMGVIQNRTRGSRLVFYNDHAGGQDIKKWEELGLPNYPNLHGVIFHGRPTDHSPDNAAYSTFRDEKIFQVSSDAFMYTGPPPNPRDTKETNRVWTNHAFKYGMIFQAHTNSESAAEGIGLADIKPTLLV